MAECAYQPPSPIRSCLTWLFIISRQSPVGHGSRAAIQSGPSDLGSSDRRRALVYRIDGFCWLNEHWHSWSPRWPEGMAQRWNTVNRSPVFVPATAPSHGPVGRRKAPHPLRLRLPVGRRPGINGEHPAHPTAGLSWEVVVDEQRRWEPGYSASGFAGAFTRRRRRSGPPDVRGHPGTVARRTQ